MNEKQKVIFRLTPHDYQWLVTISEEMTISIRRVVIMLIWYCGCRPRVLDILDKPESIFNTARYPTGEPNAISKMKVYTTYLSRRQNHLMRACAARLHVDVSTYLVAMLYWYISWSGRPFDAQDLAVPKGVKPSLELLTDIRDTLECDGSGAGDA